MTNVCVFDSEALLPIKYANIQIHNFVTLSFFPKQNFDFFNFLRNGLNGEVIDKKIRKAEFVDELYRTNDPRYENFIQKLIAFLKCNNIDVILSANNIIHPEILINELKSYVKILGVIDDPYVTYTKTIPYAWAFDGVFYITPSISKRYTTKAFLKHIGVKKSYWFPHSPPQISVAEEPEDAFFTKRDKEIAYVGNPTGSKLNTLIHLKHTFGERFHLHGRWRMKGFYGAIGLFTGDEFMMKRVHPVPVDQLYPLYRSIKIGINMHVSTQIETGNKRMYELPFCGAFQLCDKAAHGTHNLIFKENEEIVYYDDLNDLKDKIHYYLENDQERIKIARQGFFKAQKNYLFTDNFEKMITYFTQK